MTAPHPIVGIIGGMGPEATVDLMSRVIAATPAQDDADHIHMIVDCNPKIPSRIAALLDKTGESPSPELCRMARSLEASGAAFLAMPCNTAHAYLEDIEAAVSIPVLDMPKLAAQALSGLVLQRKTVGVLASTAVLKTGLYDRILGKHGLSAVYPQDQGELMRIIRGVKRGDKGAAAAAQFKTIARQLFEAGSDVLLIACTELSVLSHALGDDLPAVDAMDALAREIVRSARLSEQQNTLTSSARAVSGTRRM